ncbi:hypothetical protein H0H92_015299, partial [Tricholoma furcatifolium]
TYPPPPPPALTPSPAPFLHPGSPPIPPATTPLSHGTYRSPFDHPHDQEQDYNTGSISLLPQRDTVYSDGFVHVESSPEFPGNFVLDSEVPSKLLDMCALRTKCEFTHMRYSAATCDPNDFKSSSFTLRQIHYNPPRRTELFIVMTMYNEDKELFCRTMHGVIKNIAHLCKRERSKTWGKDGWKKVV